MGMSRLEGQREMQIRLVGIAQAAPVRAGGALYRVAGNVMRRSQREFVPVKFSVLRDSGRVEEPKVTSASISVDLTYGGAASAYALAVHEHPSKYDPPSWKGKNKTVTFHPAGHGPKYLERPIVEAERTLLLDVAQEMVS